MFKLGFRVGSRLELLGPLGFAATARRHIVAVLSKHTLLVFLLSCAEV